MTKTIFITGASSGFGRLTATLFAEKGWNVVATMRNPSKEKEFKKFKNILITKLDVTNPKSIKTSVLAAIKKFKKIDVLLNNAGYGLFGKVEGLSMTAIENQINTNLLGYIRVAKEIIPHMKKSKSGMIINNSSILGTISIPMASIYSASKFGIEGFSEGLRYELKESNIKVKLLEPGNFNTSFVKHIEYSKTKTTFAKESIGKSTTQMKQGKSSLVAKTIWKIANSNNFRVRYTVGFDAKLINLGRRVLGRRFIFKVFEITSIPKNKK